jgi:hypothetical protein
LIDIGRASSRQVESFRAGIVSCSGLEEIAELGPPDYHRQVSSEGLDVSLIEPLMALALIVLAVALVEILTHHWLVEIVLYAVLGLCGLTALFFVYGAAIDLVHALKSKLKRRLQANNDQA